ncbi:MAG: hypothetical protein ABI939_04080 [Anaerolineaceae bacterium]
MPREERIPYEHESSQDRARRQINEALAATADTQGSNGPLAKKRVKEAASYSLGLFREIANSPVFQLGRDMDSDELATLVSETISAENLPPSLRGDAREIIDQIASLRAGGNRQDADQYARSASQAFGTKLARSSWKGIPEDDFDPRDVVSRIPR